MVQYLKQIDPDLLDRVKLYQAGTALFRRVRHRSGDPQSLQTRVELPTGALPDHPADRGPTSIRP